MFALALGLASAAGAHIGSPNVFYEGQAGPYSVRVVVKTPGVVPGLAEITVRVDDPAVERVTVRPVHWEAALGGAPPPDVARPVRGDAALFTAELWLMTAGSYSVYVAVEGERGTGTAIVPVQSVATRRLAMPPWLGAALAGLGLLLVAGAVRLAGAAVESVQPPGAPPPRRRMAGVMTGAVAVLALAVYGGKTWWDSVDADYLRRLWETYGFSASVRVEDGWRLLELDLDDERWQRATPIVPDHGKLMHMFLVREPELDAFAHVHPVRTGEGRFVLAVPPPLPAGDYRIYADVTHESGFAQTLTEVVELPATGEGGAPPPGLEPDPDDSWHAGGAQEATRHAFADGTVMTWERDGPIRADEATELAFSLRRADGAAAPLEPYMGMRSHAAVRRRDGSVFVHLHPTGTISMAAQELFARRGAPEGGAPAMDHAGMDHGTHGVSRVAMPYEFPLPGTYRVWVQVKSGGRVYTGVFDAEVGPSAS